jgi:hypothetical protein
MIATSKAHASTMFLFIHHRQKRAIAVTRKEQGGRNVSQALPFVLRASLVIEDASSKSLHIVLAGLLV